MCPSEQEEYNIVLKVYWFHIEQQQKSQKLIISGEFSQKQKTEH